MRSFHICDWLFFIRESVERMRTNGGNVMMAECTMVSGLEPMAVVRGVTGKVRASAFRRPGCRKIAFS